MATVNFTPSARDVAAAALAMQPFTLYLLVVRAVAPATEVEWAHADPLLLLLPAAASLAVVPVLGVAAAAAWVAFARRVGPPWPRADAWRAAVGGAVVACVGTLGLRAVFGPHLPSFIPPEESGAPGLLLNMTAGYSEEALFRLSLLAPIFLALAPRIGRGRAVAVSAIVTGLAFAALHQLGASAWAPELFVTRFVIPGVAMSLVFLMVRPAFLVVLHCTAHVLIPLLFV
jgi:hypothetical protein